MLDSALLLIGDEGDATKCFSVCKWRFDSRSGGKTTWSGKITGPSQNKVIVRTVWLSSLRFPRQGWLTFSYSLDARRHGVPAEADKLDLEYLKERQASFYFKGGVRELTHAEIQLLSRGKHFRG